MRLPIPFEYAGTHVLEAEIGVPRAGVLADAEKAQRTQGLYASLAVLVGGSVEGLGDGAEQIVDRGQIRAAVRAMPYRSAEYLAIQAMLTLDEDDGFEGVYDCPRCGARQVAGLDGDFDTRDHVAQLPVGYREDGATIPVELPRPVTFEDRRSGEALEVVESLELRIPTLADCIKAESRYGSADPTRTMFAIYAQALTRVNNREISESYRAQFGVLIFENMRSLGVLRKLGDEMGRYGISSTIEKTCRACGKVWQAEVNTSNFFAFGPSRS